jgi:3-oxoacyl-[acyl-carrier protein] reductase
MGSDAYARAMSAPVLGSIATRAGLPRPPRLQREDGNALGSYRMVLIGAAPGGRLAEPVREELQRMAAAVHERPAGAGYPALVFDASGIASCSELVELHSFFHPAVKLLEEGARVAVLGTPPEHAGSAEEQTAQRALEGFTRSLGKELGRHGTTVQLVYVAPGAERQAGSTLRFLLSHRSAYVSGQAIRLTPGQDPPAAGFDWARPLQGRTALVTGAARGIGAAICETLTRDGARVTGLDVTRMRPELNALMERLDGEPFELDITDAGAAQRIVERFAGGLDVLVHNAGVTIDRTLARMKQDRWRTLMEINLCAPERITGELLKQGRMGSGGRIVCVSSIAGIAGNAGQTNYATSKAGVIGMVQALAPQLAREPGATISAVAPGFIETRMTAAMPLAVREAGRRMNSLLQGGTPQDVAEAVGWLASPASSALNGNVVRVCGQSLLGA